MVTLPSIKEKQLEASKYFNLFIKSHHFFISQDCSFVILTYSINLHLQFCMAHKYPKDLVDVLIDLWPEVEKEKGFDGQVHALPDDDVLEDLISISYQVSQLREEARELRFRLMFCEPRYFNEEEITRNKSVFILQFSEPLPFNEYELTKLSPAVNFYNSLIGVQCNEVGVLQIWGVIHSGSQWTHIIHGGSAQATPMPPCLGLNVVGPGRVTALRGVQILAQLTGGNIITPSDNVFQANWLKDRYLLVHDSLFRRHRKNLHYKPEEWAKIDPAFVGDLYQEFFKHLISTIRRSNHGGLIIVLPGEHEAFYDDEESLLSIKYRFYDDSDRIRLKILVLEIMEALAKICGRLHGSDYVAGWSDYVSLRDEGLAMLDSQVFKYARFVASMAAVDGAVVMSEEPELIGFGAFIQGTYEMGQSVARALDPEGAKKSIERIEGVGTRHRALYYFCSKISDAFGIVISQDGKVRTVSTRNNMVTWWDVIPIDFA